MMQTLLPIYNSIFLYYI